MQDKRTGKSKHIDFIIIDIVCVELAFLLAAFVRFRTGAAQQLNDYYFINLLILLAHIAFAFFVDSYSGIMRRGMLKELKAVVTHNFLLLAVAFIFSFFAKQSEVYSRLLFGYFFVFNTVLMYVVHILWKKILFKRSQNPKGKTIMMVVADREHIEDILNCLNNMPYKTFTVAGAVVTDADMKGEVIADTEVLTNYADMYDYVKDNIIDEVFLDYHGNHTKDIVNRFLNMGTVVHVSVEDIVSEAPNTAISHMDKYTVVTATINFMTLKQKVIKRLIDICFAIPGVIMTGIFAVIFGPIIYTQSPGPIFFKQTRVGKNGREFQIYKFRSMYMDAEERKKELMEQNKMQGLMFKMDNDPRILPIGHFIRKTSIDEFPQFLNILKGDMSVVGTRPPTKDEYNQYEQHHKSRLAIKPGLTGMWQVSGRSNITDFEEVVRLDNDYIQRFCLSLDAKIILKTVWTVLHREGSE